MHELGITENILDTALGHASSSDRITDVHLVIGQLAHVTEDSVRLYWEMVSPGTPAEGARLHFRRVAAELECLACGKLFSPDGLDLRCPDCQGVKVRAIRGEEFHLEAIDIETGGEAHPQNVGSQPEAG